MVDSGQGVLLLDRKAVIVAMGKEELQNAPEWKKPVEETKSNHARLVHANFGGPPWPSLSTNQSVPIACGLI
jgi:hypothetical protein